MIIRVNQQGANMTMQVIVLVFQFLIILATIVQALYCLQAQSGQNLQFKQFSYFSITKIVELLKVSQITVLSVLVGFNISYLAIIIASVKWKRLDHVNHYLWQVYPFCFQWLIIQNGAYAIIKSDNIILGSFSLITTIIIGMGINIYTFRQSDSQLLIRMQSDKIFVPLSQIFLSCLSGLMLQYTEIVQPYLIFLLIYDVYYGPKFFFSPISEFQILKVNKYMKCASFIRIPFILLVLIFQDLRAFTIAVGFIPLILKVCVVTLDKLSLTVIYQNNGYLQQICAEKGQVDLRNNLVESYISYFFDVINLPEPRNRVLMLSLFCNHMSICTNLKCYCQNKKFVDTISVTSQLDLDIRAITQQINYQIGASQIKDSYEYLILLFVDNYLKKIKKDSLYERLIMQLTLLEIQRFPWRLFQTKLRFKKIKVQFHRFHPVMIQRQGSQILTNKALYNILVNCKIIDKINMREIISYQRNLEFISKQIIKVAKMKLTIFDLIRQNYQSPVPYLLHKKTINYLKLIQSLEYKIDKISGNKMKTQLALNLISTFYSFIKVDYLKRNSFSKKLETLQESDFNCAYVISEFNGKQLIIKEFSENFVSLIGQKQSIQGAEVEILVPKFLHDFHQKTIDALVTNGKTSLLTSDFRSLNLAVKQHIKEVDILVRVNYQSLQKLQILAFVKDLNKNEALIIASMKGNIETFTKKAGKDLKLDKMMIANLNLFYLNPDINQNVKGNAQIEGFLLLPKVNNMQLNEIQYYKYFLNKPQDCYIFYINATYGIQSHGNVSFFCLKVHTYYNLKPNNFKYVALDIAFRQVMIKNHLRTEKYHTTVESQKQIIYFQKFHSAQESDVEIMEDCDDVESSEHGLPQLKLQPAPEFISSLLGLDSNRNQQTKQLLSMEQPTDNNGFTKRDISFDSENKMISGQQISRIPQLNSDFTVQISPEQNSQVIELIIELDNQNIYEQIQIISQQMKFKDKQKETKSLFMRRQKRKQTAISSTLSEGRLNSYSMISRMIKTLMNQEQQDFIQLKCASLFLIIVNIVFVLAFVINMIAEFRGVQRDSVNQSYPLILYQDINAILIGINLQELDQNKYLNLSKDLINMGAEQYQNQSIYVNDLQMDYHLFLQLLDDSYIIVNQSNVTHTYIEKYFFKQFMIEQLRTINEKSITDFRGIEESFLMYNYPLMATELLYLKEHTTDDVIGRIDEMNQISMILLLLSIFFNFLALSLLTFKSCMIINWRNKLTNTMFLFPNLTSFTSILSEMCHTESGIIDKKQLLSNEIENNKLKQTSICYILLVPFILLVLSLGFYFPLFLYVQYQQDQTININQVMTELTLMQLGMSTQFSNLLLTYTNPNIITDYDIFNQTIQLSEESERLILYSVPFDSNYNDLPIIQQYSQTPLCNCSLLDDQLQNGYNGFLQYTKKVINSIETIHSNFDDTPQFYEIFQSYLIVFQYQITVYQELLVQLNLRTDAVISTLTLITIISQIIIIIIQIATLILNYRTQVQLIKNGKELLYLFTPPLINANKYIYQKLMKITQI